MQALKLTILGEFWDSQIYEGRLYLFHRDGTIRTVDWDRIISEWPLKQYLKLALECGFARSDYLYGSKWELFFADSETRQLLERKFSRLAKTHLEIRTRQLESATLRVQTNPFPFPHADSTIYRHNMYVASHAGIFEASCKRGGRYPIGTKPTKHWDSPVVKIAASYTSLALAAVDEGLFELSIDGYRSGGEPTNLSHRHCTSCEWTYYSIYGSSHLDGGFLAQFRLVSNPNFPDWNEREQDKVLSEKDIFAASGFSCGTKDKLCLVEAGSLHFVRYKPWLNKGEDQVDSFVRQRAEREQVFTYLQERQLPTSEGQVVAAAVGLFGTVLEVGDELLVLRSDDLVDSLGKEVVTWRTFPRAKHYENQLHVIYDDRLEMLSFNHDYFLNQKTKVSGFRYSEAPVRRQRS